jgi:hypothetical protein
MMPGSTYPFWIWRLKLGPSGLQMQSKTIQPHEIGQHFHQNAVIGVTCYTMCDDLPPAYSRQSVGYSYRRTKIDICSICQNVNLEHEAEEGKIIRFNYFHLVESAELEDCIYCSLIYHALVKLGAEIKEDGYPFITVHAVKGKPFFISWDDANSEDGLNFAEIFKDDGTHLIHTYRDSIADISSL